MSTPPRLLALTAALLQIAAPAHAAERRYSVSSFDRIRIDGPFRVELTLGKPPGGSAEGAPSATDRVELRVEGDTLIVRAGGGAWEEQAQGAKAAPIPVIGTIRVSTPSIRAAMLIGGGRLTIAGPLRGQRVDLMLTGSGAMSAGAVAADQLVATVIGSGTLTLKGKAAKTRLSSNGTTRILAAGLVADDLTVASDGAGETVAQARYTARINAAGIGAVTVYGKPACVVNKNVQGPVSCGQSPPPT